MWGQTPPLKTSETWVVTGRMPGCGDRERKQLEVVLERSPEPLSRFCEEHGEFP